VFEGLVGALICATLGSAFAAADAALSSLNPARVTALRDETKGLAHDGLERYLANPSAQQSTWLAGRVVCMSLAAVLVAQALAPFVPHWAPAPLGALGALVTYGTLAEIGITLARSRADDFAAKVLPFLRPFELLLLPLAAPLSALGRRAAQWVRPEGPRDARLTETEVQWVVAEGQKHGSLGQEPADMIRNVLELKDLVARDVMVPRTRVCAIELTTPLPEVLRFVASEGHSRFPVYRDNVDNVVGLLYAKDLFRLLRDDKLEATPLGDIIRAPVNFVPEMQGVSSVLREMRGRRLHMAIVIDEFGGVSGIVTLEDILEVIVGEIRDEYDTEEAPIQDLGDGRLLADAAVSVADLSTYLGAEIPQDGDYESLGGLLTHQAGRVPAVGTRIEAFNLSFIVREADEKRVSKVEILRPRPLSELPAPLSTEAPSVTLEVAPATTEGPTSVAPTDRSPSAPAPPDRPVSEAPEAKGLDPEGGRKVAAAT
jgi:CBS domain containing-hemolysin-like protein